MNENVATLTDGELEQEIRDLNKIFDTDMNEFIGYYGTRFSQLCSERERRRK
jgi:hypothetical protein